MILASSLLSQAVNIVRQTPSPSEVELRRAVSTAYYGLFHTLIEAGSMVLAAYDPLLQAQVSRAYNHGSMRKVCEDIRKCRTGQYPIPFDRLLTPPIDGRLFLIADNFLRVQEARHTADYDLAAQLTATYLVERVLDAERAAQDFAQIRHLPETRVFLTALLLSERWTRRG